MERFDSTRAARLVIGAGTLAAAMVAITAGRASAQTTGCIGEVPTVCGHVYTESNNTANFQPGEGTENITVVVTTTGGVPVGTVALPSNPTSSGLCSDVNSVDCGYFYFDIPTTGDYLVCIVVNGQNTSCKPVTGGIQGQFADLPVPTSSEPQDAEPPYTNSGGGAGTGTPGYWKNHPDAWPAEGVTVGGVLYQGPTIQTAIKLMGKVSGDKTYSMFSALIAAKLNTTPSLQNNYDCIAGTLFHADAWMTAHPVGALPAVKASSDAWQQGAEDWHQKLDDYNNGKLCAPHRD
jgi:hypothetical protein